MSAPVDAVQQGMQHILMEQLARQMLETAKPADGDAASSAAADAYRDLFPQILADAVQKDAK
jgi:hypothetical protein